MRETSGSRGGNPHTVDTYFVDACPQAGITLGLPEAKNTGSQVPKSQVRMTRLIISRQYNVDEWFLPALKEVAVRAKPLTTGKVNELGLDFALQVMALREKVRGAPCPARFVSAKSH